MYFANELALKRLLGKKAFTDFKEFFDPCCKPTIAYRYEVICNSPGSYTISVYATASKDLPSQIAIAVASVTPDMSQIVPTATTIFYIPTLVANEETLVNTFEVVSGSVSGATFYTVIQTLTGIKSDVTPATYPICE
jgi:uncharacterized protein YlxP (DUF503 family)